MPFRPYETHQRFQGLPGMALDATRARSSISSKSLDGIVERWGDGLVPLHSALGLHKEPHRALSIPEDHRWVGRGMNHFDLLSRPDVYEQIRLWLS